MRARETHEDGFMLVALIVAIFLILLAMSVAAPRVAMELRREREVEAAHRAGQYTRAIRSYYGKFKRYPGTLEQLEKTNNQRFLRQRYVDPFTGEANWKIIHVGEQKTTVKGFFGQDLPGLANGLGAAANLGSAAGSASTTGGSATSAFGSPSAFGSGAGSNSGPSGQQGGVGQGSGTGFGGSTPTTAGSGGFGSGTAGTGVASQSATSFTGGGGQIMGVGTVHSGEAMLTVNEQTSYQDWEFLYDPRIEQLRAKVNLFGGGISTGGASNGLGTAPGTNGFGTNPGGNGFGNMPGSNGFGGPPAAPAGSSGGGIGAPPAQGSGNPQ